MPATIDPSKLDEKIRERWEVDGSQDQNYIVCAVAKGPWIIRGGPEGLYVVTDLKTAGYPYENCVGKLILKGGNWTKDRKGRVAATSEELYITETAEELDDEKLSAELREIGGSISRLLAKNSSPFANYFTVTPRSSHGHPKKGYGPEGVVRHYNSIFVSEIEYEALRHELKLARKTGAGMLAGHLTKLSPESAVAVLGWKELREMASAERGEFFPFGEGVILADVLDKRYDWNGKIQPDAGVVALKLDSDPIVVYQDLEERRLFEIDPLKEDARDEAAFRANKPPGK